MTVVFTDASYFIGLSNPRDALHPQCRDALAAFKVRRLVTTNLVISETFSYFSGWGPSVRQSCSTTMSRITKDPDAEIVFETGELHSIAVRLFEERSDKGWSLADCLSFVVMRRKAIVRAPTSDHHFTQAGFEALLRHD